MPDDPFGTNRQPTESEFSPKIMGQEFQSPPGLALRQFVRRNLLIAVSTAIFVFATILILEQIDRVYYQREKKDLMNELFNRQRLLAGSAKKIVDDHSTEYVDRFMRASRRMEPDERVRTPEEIAQLDRIRQEEESARQKKITAIRESAEELLRKHPYVFRYTFSDVNGNMIVDVQEMRRRHNQNDWSNSLFIQDFWMQFSNVKLTQLNPNSPESEPAAISAIYVTTPRDIAEIKSLTQKWRIRSGIIVILIFIFYGFILWSLLLPVRNVITALDKGAAVGSPLIEKPRIVLEKYYNNLARDATLSIFSTSLRDFVSSQRVTDPHPLMEHAPALIQELFPVQQADIWDLRLEENSGLWLIETAFLGNREHPDDFETVLIKRVGEFPPNEMPHAWNAPKLEFFDESDRLHHWFPTIISTGENHVSIAVIHLLAIRHGSSSWWRHVAESIGRELRFSIRMITEQRRLILQEKSKANITLSRNIGHDLTNIIATSKLELLNIKTLLEMPRDEVYGSPVKQKIFRESLEALLNNTRFLQETVNLYRSFTYLSRPKFEEVSLNDLVADVSALFKLSLSRSIEIHLDLDPGIRPMEVEPRLLRLALFNLLSNAADSIKRASSERPQGRIMIRTAAAEEERASIISVEDNGGGIRDREGRLLDPHEIAGIFQLGYSTKEKDSGEGLGLNWVQQIVHEFHGGELSARNLGEQGAVFSIKLEDAEHKQASGEMHPTAHASNQTG